MARIPVFDIPQGDTRTVSVDYSATASDFGVNVSSAAWTVEEGNSVTLGGSVATSSNITTESAVAGANRVGCSLIKVTATMTDAQTVSKYFKINVVDPTC
jgi:hypothetical protein